MTDDNEALSNANPTIEEEEPDDPEPLSEQAAQLYMNMLLQAATTLRKEGAMASDAVRKAELALRAMFPKAPQLSDRALAKIGLVIMKIKKPATDPKVIAALAQVDAKLQASKVRDMITAITGTP